VALAGQQPFLPLWFDVNVFGAYLCAREGALRLSRDRGGKGGSIVLISSAAARLGSATPTGRPGHADEIAEASSAFNSTKAAPPWPLLQGQIQILPLQKMPPLKGR
jgi:hypothetical protein